MSREVYEITVRMEKTVNRALACLMGKYQDIWSPSEDALALFRMMKANERYPSPLRP